MACNKENGCDCEILGVRCLPENSFVDNTDKGCNGVYTDSRCIRVNGLKGIAENSRLNSVLRDLLVAIRDQPIDGLTPHIESGFWWIGDVNTGIVAEGKSAYQIAVDNGYEGSELEWLDSLRLLAGDNIEIDGNVISAIGTESVIKEIDTQRQLFTDKSFALKEYNNESRGTTYLEGAVDLAYSLTGDSLGMYSFRAGAGTESIGNFSAALGIQTVANEYASLAIGRYSEEGTPQNNWVNGAPIFKVGNGTNSANRKNAYTLYNDGRSEQEKSFEITTPGEGVILKSPNGTKYLISVDDNGDLITTQV